MILLANISKEGVNVNKLVNKNFAIEPIDLAYIKANLKCDMECRIIDNLIEKASVKNIIKYIKSTKPSLLLLQFNQHAINEVKQIIDAVRSYNIHITATGMFPSIASRDIINYLGFDSVIVGDNVETFNDLATVLNKKHSLRGISGLVFKNGKNIIYNKPSKPLDLDRINDPDRSLTLQAISLKAPIGILSSKGCPWSKCSFCRVAAFNNILNFPPWRERKIEYVLEEIKKLVARFNYRKFSFLDDCFFGKDKNWKERGYKFARLIKESNLALRYSIDCRADQVDKKLLNTMIKSGLESVYIGIEAANSTSLCKINKGLTLKQIKRAIKICKELKLKLFLGFIPFSYNYSFNEVKKNLLFLKETDIFQKGLYTNILVPLYETEVWKGLNKGPVKYVYPKMKWQDPRVGILYKKLCTFSHKPLSNKRSVIEKFIEKAIKKLNK